MRVQKYVCIQYKCQRENNVVTAKGAKKRERPSAEFFVMSSQV